MEQKGLQKCVSIIVLVVAVCCFELAVAQTTDEDTSGAKLNSTGATTQNLPPGQKPSAESPQRPTVSKEEYDRIMPAIERFNLIFETVSILLTFLSGFVYAMPRMRCATAHYLVVLNGADTVSGFMMVTRTFWGTSQGIAASTSAAYHYFTVYALYTSVVCRRLVYCLSAMVSLERFFVIAFPMKARYIKLARYPKISIALMATANFAIHIYLPLKYAVVPSPSGAGYAMVTSDAFIADPTVFDETSNAAKYMFSYAPLILCLVTSVLLMVALQRHAASRQALQEGKDDGKAAETRSAERQLAMTIWLSTLLYALLSLPTNTIQLVSTYSSTFRFMGLEHYLYTLVDRFAYTTLIASRYTNFLSYLGLSTTFRQSLIRLLCPKIVVRRIVGEGHSQQMSRLTSEMSQTGVSTARSISE